ncbi:L-2-hydroxyglutarate oxidase [Paenibacillus koleovorans]|uniref:L-2-hydroxyglutarate oxidase n=1 Tax=Paenibacillus koleovorans TaxID=121608 RepID=UPI000FD8364B|nr:L-2-hydroxyglutarate oxidase [Paenibacillus koleovorans]
MTPFTNVATYDYVIVGAGIIGLTISRELKLRDPDTRIAVLEKEPMPAYHASGRNSGVLHAGFYYTANSLKARFTRDGNRMLRDYCEKYGLDMNRCGKLIVAADEEELRGLEELKRRGDTNGVELHWVDEVEAMAIDPNAKTFRKALYSPTTVTVDPQQVCETLWRENERNGVHFYLDTPFVDFVDGHVHACGGELTLRCGYLINAAGLYADKIAQALGFGRSYTIIPFKGLYLKYAKNKTDIRTNIYPVPNLGNPFLGVHFTKTVDGGIKIGPTAIPALWRENYKGFSRFRLSEFLTILFYEAKLVLTNSFGFRRLAIEEMKKYFRSNFIRLSQKLARGVDPEGFGEFGRPGIRAQLLHKDTLELVQDFVIEGDHRSMHVLNAVSPAFTCSMPFARYVVDEVEEKRRVVKEEDLL